MNVDNVDNVESENGIKLSATTINVEKTCKLVDFCKCISSVM